ncbi:hypothetical protein ATY41_11890 [Leifsonia xyli subsp. xyli]|uniref:MutT-like domain protein n=2 Tax=Leifsonia xyli subsp. xyli TaxID=59736 RepID=Q6AHK2_LEIXX|nr:NUDIX domain-containing protein [Leifsonia xyli]AAT88143.1 MutT-like domain protein [Leifsonia xyli subsp. xyli str. CTCB07]ODA89882.1 hypothetical protein ATY41_11890 [Leifsonia xyli subsp. xyli]
MQQIPYVTALITDASGRILLGRHTRDQLWGTIGGALKTEEDPRLGLSREVFEELSIEVEVGRLLNAHCGPLTTTTYESGDVVNVLALVYECSMTDPAAALTLDETEISEANWFTEA